MNKKPDPEKKEYRHFENEKMRMTEIKGDITEYFKEDMESLEKRGLVFPDSKGGKIALMGFTSFSDNAGDFVFHYKIFDNGRGFLYLKTGHPESEQFGNFMITLAKIKDMVILNALDQIKEMGIAFKNAENNELEMKPGIHPGMNYIKDYEKKKD